MLAHLLIFLLLFNSLELPQESYIILRIKTQVVYLVFDLRNALYTHPKGKA